MGFKTFDVAPVAANGPSAVTPYGKDVLVKAFQINRTDTTASVKAVLPADATMIDFLVFGAASNAGTSASISVGTTSASNEIINAQDVKSAGGLIRPTTAVAATAFALENIPLTGDTKLYGQYTEAGTVSSAGGPYTVLVFYVR